MLTRQVFPVRWPSAKWWSVGRQGWGQKDAIEKWVRHDCRPLLVMKSSSSNLFVKPSQWNEMYCPITLHVRNTHMWESNRYRWLSNSTHLRLCMVPSPMPFISGGTNILLDHLELSTLLLWSFCFSKLRNKTFHLEFELKSMWFCWKSFWINLHKNEITGPPEE